jgi:putative phosphoribosyl transferase
MSVVTIERPVKVPFGRGTLEGILAVPPGANGMVLFAHGSGSGRFSPRNQLVAKNLADAGLGTLLIDLLAELEAEDRDKVFDIELLAERLKVAADWLKQNPETRNLPLCLFGASTGAAAALVAAVRHPQSFVAVVARGGRPDLVMDELSEVHAPTLLIVGSRDDVVVQLNKEALGFLRCPKKMVVIPGATHLFPEPGALEEVARLAQEWFCRHLPSPTSPQTAGGVEPKLKISDLEPMC